MSGTYSLLYRELLDGMPSRFEADQLLLHVCGRRPHELDRPADGPVPDAQKKKLRDIMSRRAQGVPLQYLLGEWEFYSLPFRVGPGVLIPRQDTETLVDAALEQARRLDAPQILDLCSGTGCVAVALARHLPGAAVSALEISDEAYAYLVDNIARNRVPVRPVLGDLREYTHPLPLDLIVSNPPYIPRAELARLQREVGFEPPGALDGGEDGLCFHRAIARRYQSQLRPGGLLLLEVGAGQAGQVCALLAGCGYTDIRTRTDLGGVERVVQAQAKLGSATGLPGR